MNKIPFRQVHLDFHTSGLIENIGEDFCKEDFQAALKKGHVNSITLFSKCHHGWAYHPTEVHEMHPYLKFDLLQAQLDACKEINVAAPVYISAGIDEKEAVKHPEWLIRNKDESTTWVKDFVSEAGYHLLCYNTPYLDLLLAQIEEVMVKYNPTGIFLDISAVRPCYCASCRNTMLAEGKDPRNDDDVMELAEKVYDNYGTKVMNLIHSYNPDTTIFHNSGHITRGRRDIAYHNTHLELESLPTGGWGYDHFPMSASYAMNMDLEYLGMTGKFHSMWGEFGGFKHPNALRYETALSLAFGAKCSIGDQLHPLGKMDHSTYNLIGKAYKEVEEKEPWCQDTVNVADIGILSEEAFNSTVSNRDVVQSADIGANRMMLEGKYLYRIIDKQVPFDDFKLLILPDSIRIDENLQNQLDNYLASGGKILATGQSGLSSEEDKFVLPLGVEYLGQNQYKPDYIRPKFDMSNQSTAFAMYEQGYLVKQKSGEEIATRENPYFNRDMYSFCSHQHTPNNPENVGSGIILTDQTAYIAWDVFSDYSKTGSLHLKEIVAYTIDKLIGNIKTIGVKFADRGVSTLTYQKNKDRFIHHLLFAHTTMRGKFHLSEVAHGNIEVIESIVPLYNISTKLRINKEVNRVYLVPQNIDIPFEEENGTITYIVPKVECHQMICIE